MRSAVAWSPLGLLTAFAALGSPSPELLDLAARVHYGYYHAEPRAVETALAALDRLEESPDVLYYRDFAALRLAQLGSDDRGALKRLGTCARRDVPQSPDRIRAAEEWVLVAACAQLAGDDDRRDHALARARERDDDNPRILLVEAWGTMARVDAGADDVVVAKLTAVVEAFAMWAPSLDDPDWGHAEALTALGAAALERGQVRAARDLIERALLLVPDYGAALEVRIAMQNARSGQGPL